MTEVESSDQTWGDIEEEESEKTGTKVFETEENGVKRRTVVDYITHPDGKKVKVTKTYQINKRKVKVNKKRDQRTAERRKWKKFGDCKGHPPGIEAGITVLSELVEIETVHRRKQAREAEATKLRLEAGEQATWTSRAQDLSATSWEQITGGRERGSSPARAEQEAKNEGLFVPSSLTGKRDDNTTVRVTNLSVDTKEADLRELFRPFGYIQRVYLAWDKFTNSARGFAFVTFQERAHAERAIEKLDGYPYDHLILHVEWSNPKEEK